eukprot:5904873-Pyramimonas_sp.AAC.1
MVLEGRGSVATLRHQLRSGVFRLLTSTPWDNISLILASEKGWYSAPGLLRICRRLLALALVADVRAHRRWHPSELNAADGGSRLWEGTDALLR